MFDYMCLSAGKQALKEKRNTLICLSCIGWIMAMAALPMPVCAENGRKGTEDAGNPFEVIADQAEKIPEIPGLVYEKQMDFTYVNAIDIYYYEGGYKFYDVYESAQYLQMPEGKEIPSGLGENVKILPGNPQKIYMAATGAMALAHALDALDQIRFSSLTADGWYVDAAAEAMEKGEMVFAGKYREPDYELLVGEGCDLAVESTMILHTPKVQEMLENLDIPVFIDRSSYETHPLGRSEWVKVYGALLGKEEEAENFFQGQIADLESLGEIEDTQKTVAFFYIDSTGTVVVRRNEDSVPQMIRMAGGEYALGDVRALQESMRSSVNMTMEEFYASAVDADYLIYNSTIDAPVHTLEELFQKSELLRDFKAVQEGNVWCADKYLYQATDITGQLIMDFYYMLHDVTEAQMTFLQKISSDM